MKKLAVLISNAGTGTNLQAIIDAIESKQLQANITCVVSDSPHAFGLERAKKHAIPSYIISDDNQLIKLLTDKKIDYIILAGWKSIIPQAMVALFSNHILNIHPGLIPDRGDETVKNPDGTEGLWNKGKFTDKAIKNFLEKKATYAGSSVHFLTDSVDFGPVLSRCYEKILSDDTIESLYGRLKKKENEICVEALIKLCNL